VNIEKKTRIKYLKLLKPAEKTNQKNIKKFKKESLTSDLIKMITKKKCKQPMQIEGRIIPIRLNKLMIPITQTVNV